MYRNILQVLYFALSFLGNMAMLTAAHFFALERQSDTAEKVSQAGIGTAFVFVSVSSVIAWVCNYAYYSIFGHPW